MASSCSQRGFVAPVPITSTKTKLLLSSVSRRPRPRPLPHPHTVCLPCATLSSFSTQTSTTTTARTTEIKQHDDADTSVNVSQNSSSSSSSAKESLTLLEWPAITSRVLSHASTELGRDYLLDDSDPRFLYIPSTREQSNILLQHTREFQILQQCILNNNIQFKGAVNILPLCQLASKGRVLVGEELHSISVTLANARLLRRSIIDLGSTSLPLFHALAEPLATCAQAEKELVRCVDDYGELLESAIPELREIRDQIRNSTADATSILNDIMNKNSDAVQDRLITSRYDRFVIPVKASHKAIFKSAIVHDASATGNTAYMEPTNVKPVNDRLRKLAAKERAVILKELTRLSRDIVAKLITPHAQTICKFIATLDAASARFETGKSLNAVDVSFHTDSTQHLYLPSVRHPLLMWKAVDTKKKLNDDDVNDHNNVDHGQPAWHHTVVPSTYVLAPSIRCVCVTGPNTGGKTLTLKTLGVISLMAKAGLFIPATPARSIASQLGITNDDNKEEEVEEGIEEEEQKITIPYFDTVLADIGDDQSLVQSLSTFSGHVRRIKRILAASTSQSLVLLDEIGSGTDPAEGAALGMAVLKHLALENRARLTFATTHHGELKTLKYEKDTHGCFENASVEFDDVAMRPTYRLIWGIPGRSNALAIASRLGLDETVIQSARDLLQTTQTGSGSESKIEIESMITSLENDKRMAEQARLESETQLAELLQMKQELEARLNKLRASETALRKEQKDSVNREVNKAKEDIKNVIREMQQGGGSAQSASRATEKLRKLESSLQLGSDENDRGNSNESELETIQNAQVLNIGDKIMVKGLSDGLVEVVDRTAKNNEVVVAVGAMHMKVKIRDIIGVRRLSKGDDSLLLVTRNSNSGGNRSKTMVRTAVNSLDVRGERVDGAIAKIETAMDKAFAMGSLWIIHGHGTGRLKSGVRKFLAEQSIVAKFEDAEQSKGGTGVTVVHF